MVNKKSKKAVKKVTKVSKKNKDDSKVYAFITTFFGIIGFIIAMISWKDDKYVMFYAKQSLVIFIFSICVFVFSAIIGWIPIIGWILTAILYIGLLVIWVMSWINALSNEKRKLFLVSNFTDKIKL